MPIERNRASAYRTIHTEISRLELESKIHPVLVVDEAHHLRNEVLDLRLLTNYAMDAERRLCLLLVDMPELRRRLRMAVIARPAHRGALPPGRTPPARNPRLPLASPAARRLYAATARSAPVEALFQATQGLPR